MVLYPPCLLQDSSILCLYDSFLPKLSIELFMGLGAGLHRKCYDETPVKTPSRTENFACLAVSFSISACTRPEEKLGIMVHPQTSRTREVEVGES